MGTGCLLEGELSMQMICEQIANLKVLQSRQYVLPLRQIFQLPRYEKRE